MRTNVTRGFILFFRTSAVAVKAAFMLFAARALTSMQYGEFVLFASSMAIVIPLLGFSLNQFTSRELKGSVDDRAILTNHFAATSVTALLFLALTPFFAETLGIKNWILFFIGISFLDHLTNEAYTLLLPMGRPLLANGIFFLKIMGTYGLITLDFFISPKGSVTLFEVFSIWFGALALLGVVLVCIYPPKTMPTLDILKRGWKVGIVFLIISFLIKAYFNLDKVIVSHVASLEDVSMYGMIFSIAWTVHTLVEASMIGPSIKSFLKSPDDRTILEVLILKACGFYLVLWLVLAAAFPLITRFLGKPELLENTDFLHVFLLAGFFYSVAWSVMMKLYSLYRDRQILHSSLIGFAVFVGLMFLNRNSPLDIAINVAITSLVYMVLLLGYYGFYLKTVPRRSAV